MAEKNCCVFAILGIWYMKGKGDTAEECSEVKNNDMSVEKWSQFSHRLQQGWILKSILQLKSTRDAHPTSYY